MIAKTYSAALLAALALIAAPLDRAALAQDAAVQSPLAGSTQPETQAETQAEASVDAAEVDDAAPDAADDAAEADGAAAADAPPASASETAAEAAPAEQQTEEESRLGTYYLLSEHQDWTLRCLRTNQPKDPCEMYKLLVDDEDNAVAEITMIPLTNGEVAAGATLVAPLETDLLEGLGLQVNGGEMRGYPFSVCTQLGCVSRIGFTDAELNAMKRGARMFVQLVPFGSDPADPVRLEASLSGFTAAFDTLVAYVEAPVEETQVDEADEEAETETETETETDAAE